jgi:hypothetical protein
MGIESEYISIATIDARAKNGSVLVVIIAFGAVPARIASRRTAVLVEEPRVKGSARMHSLAFFPDKGCRRSVISPV